MSFIQETIRGEIVYRRKQVLLVPNGDNHQTELRFAITKEALDYYFSNKLFHQKKNDPADFSRLLALFFSGVYFKKFLRNFKLAFFSLTRTYKGFPTALHRTEVIEIVFSLGQLTARVLSPSYDHIAIRYHLLELAESKKRQVYLTTHELLHVVSQEKEGERATAREFLGWVKEYETKLSADQELLRDHVDKFFMLFQEWDGGKLVENKQFTLSPLSFIRWIDGFYQNTLKNFKNLVNDLALNIIALELKNKPYFRHHLKEDRTHLLTVKQRLKELQLMDVLVRSNDSLSDDLKKSLQEGVQLLQFIYAYGNLPFNLIPLAVLGETYWENTKSTRLQRQAKKCLARYQTLIQRFCSQRVYSEFLKTYQGLSSLAYAGRIHHNPENPSLTQKIHNVDFLQEAKRVREEFFAIVELYVRNIEQSKQYWNEREFISELAA